MRRNNKVMRRDFCRCTVRRNDRVMRCDFFFVVFYMNDLDQDYIHALGFQTVSQGAVTVVKFVADALETFGLIT